MIPNSRLQSWSHLFMSHFLIFIGLFRLLKAVGLPSTSPTADATFWWSKVTISPPCRMLHPTENETTAALFNFFLKFLPGDKSRDQQQTEPVFRPVPLQQDRCSLISPDVRTHHHDFSFLFPFFPVLTG